MHVWHSEPPTQAKHARADRSPWQPVCYNALQVVEKLFRLKWGRLDGLGALIISPTRELAMQIFHELRKVGARHDLSAGLLIGGKNVKEERERVNGERPVA